MSGTPAGEKVIIGLEVHCQINTRTKLFCGCSTDSKEKKPNESTCEICLGFPGSKPVANKRVLEFAILIAKALNCSLPKETSFSRKSYFYPDMSKNYQITQYEAPMASEGFVELNVDGGKKKIRITRIQVEEDPARLVHVGGDITNAKYVLVDYNRSGIPLCEIVTEPDFASPQEARAFINKLASILEHLEAVDPAQEGFLRVDANISIEGNERVEVKNIGSFKDVEKALAFEVIRQRNAIRRGGKIVRETRHFDANTGVTVGLRKKETEEDYGYMFDPDLPRIELSEGWVKQLYSKMPELPDARAERLASSFGLDKYSAEVLVYTDKALADFFERCVKISITSPQAIAHAIINEMLRCLNWNDLVLRESKYTPEKVAAILKLIGSEKISARVGKKIFEKLATEDVDPEKFVEAEGLGKISGEGEIEKIVEETIARNPQPVADYKSGKQEALNFLAGQVMRTTKGRVDSALTLKILKEKLG